MNARSFTCVYGDTHRTITDVAREHDLTAFDGRVLLALLEGSGRASTTDLEEWMREEGTQIRRSSLSLRIRSLIVVDAVDGREVRRGIRARYTLTPAGCAVARQIAGRIHETLLARQVAA